VQELGAAGKGKGREERGEGGVRKLREGGWEGGREGIFLTLKTSPGELKRSA